MKIDFSRLDKDVAKQFNDNKKEVLSDYKHLINVLQKRSSDLPWLLNNVTSRNTNFSKFFYYMRCEKLLYDLVDPEFKLSLNRPEKVSVHMWYEITTIDSFNKAIKSIVDVNMFNIRKKARD